MYQVRLCNMFIDMGWPKAPCVPRSAPWWQGRRACCPPHRGEARAGWWRRGGLGPLGGRPPTRRPGDHRRHAASPACPGRRPDCGSGTEETRRNWSRSSRRGPWWRRSPPPALSPGTPYARMGTAASRDPKTAESIHRSCGISSPCSPLIGRQSNDLHRKTVR